MTQKKPHANTGNQFARKDKRGTLDRNLTLRCLSEDHAQWQHQAAREGKKTARWINDVLNAASRTQAVNTSVGRKR